MTVALLETPPLVPPAGLGPYRRDDYEALPDEPRCELIFGRFQVSPSPTPLHQFLIIALSQELHRIAMAHGGLALTAPTDVVFADHSVVQPDILYFSQDQGFLHGRTLETPPDLLVEILSPSTGRRDRSEKLNLYAEFGVREYWIVDPQLRQVEILVNRAGQFVVQMPGGAIYHSAVLPEIRIDLEAFWTLVEARLA